MSLSSFAPATLYDLLPSQRDEAIFPFVQTIDLPILALTKAVPEGVLQLVPESLIISEACLAGSGFSSGALTPGYALVITGQSPTLLTSDNRLLADRPVGRRINVTIAMCRRKVCSSVP